MNETEECVSRVNFTSCSVCFIQVNVKRHNSRNIFWNSNNSYFVTHKRNYIALIFYLAISLMMDLWNTKVTDPHFVEKRAE
jgi:hypothetical protein